LLQTIPSHVDISSTQEKVAKVSVQYNVHVDNFKYKGNIAVDFTLILNSLIFEKEKKIK